MRHPLKWPALILGALMLLVVTVGIGVYIAGNTPAGRSLIERLTYRLSGGYVKLTGLGGTFPAHVTLDRLDLIDAHGIWLTAEHVMLTWEPYALLTNTVRVDDLHVVRVHVERAPYSAHPNDHISVPHIEVTRSVAERVELGAALVGSPAALAVRASFHMRSLEDARSEFIARRLDGEGEYELHVAFDPARMDASLKLHEPAGGPLEHLLQLPGLGALTANVQLAGPRSAERINLVLDVGDLHGRAQGTVDWVKRSADAEYSLESTALSPRADLSWQKISLQGHWRGPLTTPTADGLLKVEKLRIGAATELATLSATLAADGGELKVNAQAGGLRIPGSQPRMFEQDPVLLEAKLQMNDPTLPLQMTASHRLFLLRARAKVASPQSVSFDLRLPNVSPFAALADQDVRGDASINAQINRGDKEVRIRLDGRLGLAGGTASWLDLLGEKMDLQLAGAISDEKFSIDRLRVAARASILTMSGGALRTRSGSEAWIRGVQARWDLAIVDLATLSPDFAGNLKMAGQLTGPPNALAADADAMSTLSIRGSPPGKVVGELRVRGLPSKPSGSLQARGNLDGAPINVDLSMERGEQGAIRGFVRHAEWKSAHMEGALATSGSLTRVAGQLRVQVGELADFNRLLGMNLAGAAQGHIDFKPAEGRTYAQAQFTGTHIKVRQFAGDLQLSGAGTSDALGLTLGVQMPELRGTPASATATASLNLDAHQLRINKATAQFRNQTIKLLEPSTILYAHGVTLDILKFGVDQAVLQLDGRVAPTLDLHASLHQGGAPLVNLIIPDILSEGSIDATASLQGVVTAPTGSVQIKAAGVRFANDDASGLPAINIQVQAHLLGDKMDVDGKFNAGTASSFTVLGSAPLNADGTGDLKINGKLDVGLINPLLEARGLRAAGALEVDATVKGPISDPQIGGMLILTGGNIRDYGRGINLSQISAQMVGAEGALQIKSFKANAATGTVSMTGSIGVLQPNIPVDLRITARDAQPIASTIVTATIDADLRVHGTARARLDIVGTVTSDRTVIGIPNSLPPEVAILDVRRRGQPVVVAQERQLIIGLDVAIVAPQQILVQGRGLDAELGGEIHLSGTTAAPEVSGNFDLQRGDFAFAGKRLDFTTGRVSFDGAGLRKKIDATLDFTAQTDIADITAYLRITGLADAPRFEFSSNPSRSQDEILSLLLFGENPAQLTALQAAQIGTALASLSGVGGAGLNPLVKLQKTLGLDRLSVGAGSSTTTPGTESSGASIEAGRYISKRVYVVGKQSTAGTTQVQVDVDLTKHLKLQTKLGNGTALTQGTTSENDPGSSIGLSYQFEY